MARGSAAAYELAIGDKNYSSWSLRPWLLMRRFGLPFTERRVRLRQPDSKAAILAVSPSGKVPALKAGDLVVWDSLAIGEFLADAHPDLGLWPRDAAARAMARSASAEMHSGFAPLREHMPMDLLTVAPAKDVAEPVAQDIRRIVALWKDCRARFGAGGPFLFGAFSIADAMYAPVASRFRTYVGHLGAYGDDGTAAAYRDAIFAMPEMTEWSEGARAELAERGAW